MLSSPTGSENGFTSISIQVDGYDGKRLDAYLWDPDAQNFVLQTDPFSRTQISLENDLYNKHDTAGVIANVDQFLSAALPEPQMPSQCGTGVPGGCTYYPAWYVPYFRYLRGLAYEQLGQVDAAAQAYYELWRDFPNHIFGIAAGLKLEPVNP